jgi:LysR family glycine cleavage system transcriptional activator
MARRIPPLNPLHVFEVVARTLNLTAASRELHVTQSAVSRQIAALEAYLGIGLFRRERHGVALTPAGQAYAEQVVPAFEAIAIATERLTRAKGPGSLRVRTYTTFAAKWLIPRLPAFKQAHPGIDVRIVTAVPDVDFDRDGVDLAIQFGTGQWPRTEAHLLFRDEIEPVCTPAYLKQQGGIRRIEHLLSGPLLVSQFRRDDWDDWLVAHDRAHLAAGSERMVFSSSVLTWQAALDGLGTAIGQRALLSQELQSGQLVCPFALPLRRDSGHYLVEPSVRRASRPATAFRQWIIAAAAAA